MKKIIILLTFLTSITLVSCKSNSNSQANSSSSSSINSSISEELNYELMSSYDLSLLHAEPWDNSKLPEEQDAFLKGDITSLFINSLTNKDSVIKKVETINHSAFKGVEKCQYDEYGLKLNGGGLKITLNDNLNIKNITFTLSNFHGKDALYTFENEEAFVTKDDIGVLISFDITNKTTFTIKALDKQKFKIDKIEFYK